VSTPSQEKLLRAKPFNMKANHPDEKHETFHKKQTSAMHFLFEPPAPE
jgi:hypothetical protein